MSTLLLPPNAAKDCSVPLDRNKASDTSKDSRYSLIEKDQQETCPKMISSIRIMGYRTFTDFTVEGLDRINLFVGKNNTGKSSLLEALALLQAGENLGTLWGVLARRGEQPNIELVPGRAFIHEVDISHLFTGHTLKVGSKFSVRTTNQKPDRVIVCSIDEVRSDDDPTLFGQFAAQEPGGAAITLRISETGPYSTNQAFPLTSRGTLRNDTVQQTANYLRSRSPNEASKAQFITTSSLAQQDLLTSWNDIALKPEEDLVLEALRFIDEKIERIAPNPSPIFFGGRGGFWIKRRGEDRLPIGSFGDGIWRLLALSVVLARAKNSILLVDEVDTGLHYTVMESVWKFIVNTAKRFNVQVFATTHSYDCVHSLAKVCRDVDDAHSEINIHRIETDRERSVPFTEAEIKIAAERQIEIR